MLIQIFVIIQEILLSHINVINVSTHQILTNVLNVVILRTWLIVYGVMNVVMLMIQRTVISVSMSTTA